MRKEGKKQKGITLIALIITIIVLLILAGVSIVTLTGENGLLTRATDAKVKNEIGKVEEEVKLVIEDLIVQHRGDKTQIKPNDITVKLNEIKQRGITSTKKTSSQTDEYPIYVIYPPESNEIHQEIKVEVDKDFNVNGEVEESSNNNQWAGYIVITPETEGLTPEQKIKVEAWKEEIYDGAIIAVKDKNEDVIPIPQGFVPIEGTVNGEDKGVVIQDQTGDTQTNSSEFVWVPVEYANFKLISGYEDGGLQSVGEEPGKEGSEMATEESSEMYKSVEKFHGFYIARYEAGINDKMKEELNGVISSDTTEKYGTGNGTYKPVSRKNNIVWDHIDWGDYTTEAKKKVEITRKNGVVKVARCMYNNPMSGTRTNKTSAVSTLCYGVQWDAVMNYIDPKYVTENCDEDSFVVNSTGKGNYALDENQEEIEGFKIELSGSSPNYEQNHIYDLAGNLEEYTMEDYTGRGGYNGPDIWGLYAPASRRNINNSSGYGIGFRVALYLSGDYYLPGEPDEDIKKEGVDSLENNEDTTPYLPDGSTIIENEIDKGITIKDVNGNVWTWIEVPKTKVFTGITSETDYAAIENAMITYAADYRKEGYSDVWVDSSGNGETDLYPEDGSPLYNRNDKTIFGLTLEEYNELKHKMLTSVYKNGGFYIGKYETGSEQLRNRDNEKTITKPVIKQNVYPYNYLNQERIRQCLKSLSIDNYTCNVMYGIQWDLTCKYFEEKGTELGATKEERKAKIIDDSSSWGVYRKASFKIAKGKCCEDANWDNWIEIKNKKYTKPTGQLSMFSTGVSKRNKVLNVYDFAGNIGELTLETKKRSPFVTIIARGTMYNNNDAPANDRNTYDPVSTYSNLGFRATIY